jgi:hypothetical protein
VSFSFSYAIDVLPVATGWVRDAVVPERGARREDSWAKKDVRERNRCVGL